MKRLIFSLLYEDGNFVLSRNFTLQNVGNLEWLNDNYNFSKISYFIDELIILNVSKNKQIDKFCETIKKLTKNCFIPIAAGGGIKSIKDARNIINSGADKVVINSIIADNLDFINQTSKIYGSQSIIASVDLKKDKDTYFAYNNNGTNQVEEGFKYLMKISKLPIGEIYLNSMNKDGTGQGYDIDMLDILPKDNNLPIIIAGGAGNHNHLFDGLKNKKIDAVATAHLFNFVGDGLKNSRKSLLEKGINLPYWDEKQIENLKTEIAI